MGLLKELSRRVLRDEYFTELFMKIERIKFQDFFKLAECHELSSKEYHDLLRFADILSYSEESDDRNICYKIISMLYDDYSYDEYYIGIANAVLVRLGNFPALELVLKNNNKIFTNEEIEMEKIIKQTFQRDPHGENVFTDPQYKIYEALKSNNHFSFSGPTSLGKSFIMEAFIKYLIFEHNFTENMVILVPTRALINQVTNKMKSELIDIAGGNSNDIKYKVLSHPVIPRLLEDTKTRYIFVFTPERLISYLSNNENPKVDYMFIDEAHKMVSNKDSRGPLFYHAILQAERKSVKLFFASPNVPNTDVFLQLFEKSTEETMSVKESPVAQNRYFLDIYNDNLTLFSDLGEDYAESMDSEYQKYDFNQWLYKLGDGNKNIIYCNSTKDTIDYAISFAKLLPDKDNEQISELIELIKEHIHRDYYLIDCLKKGVGYHFGRLPQRVRERIESLFSEKIIDYLFCTSTLLEGVNLPAKNIFILNNAIGLSKFTDIDFWNLAGRAGRLTKELSGNIICTKILDKRNRWDNLIKDLEVVRSREIRKIQPYVIKGQKKFYINIGRSLEGKEFTRKSVTSAEKEIWDHYANIAFIHQIREEQSVLKANFIAQVDGANQLLRKKVKNNMVPVEILSTSSMIKEKYQNNAWQLEKINEKTMPTDVTREECQYFLNLFYDLYGWKDEESSGHAPLAKNKNKLRYYAVLMKDWMNSIPLNRIIMNIIKYYEERGEYWDVNERIPFDGKDKRIINLIINELMRDIETNIRYKMKNYFTNYYLILCERLGEENAGANWGDFLEYGTTDLKVIELQNIGLPRYLATFLLENHMESLNFENDILVSIDIDEIIANIDQGKAEYKEFMEKMALEIKE
jgi:superfamily II DNA/RNA helicase